MITSNNININTLTSSNSYSNFPSCLKNIYLQFYLNWNLTKYILIVFFLFLYYDSQYKIYYFKVNYLVIFSTFTMLYKHHFYLVPKHFHHPKIKPHTYEAVTSYSSPSPRSQQTPIFYLSLKIYPLQILYINTITQHVTFVSSIYSLHKIFQIQLHCSMYQHFIPFSG